MRTTLLSTALPNVDSGSGASITLAVIADALRDRGHEVSLCPVVFPEYSTPDGTTTTPRPAYFPAVGGFRFGFFTIGPETTATLTDVDIEAALQELSQKLPGMAEVMEPEHPGMHTTDTIDFDVVISGEIWLELDDGAEVRLQAGDSVIQNGTRHAWHNRSSQPCTLAVTLVGAAHTPA